MKSLNKLLYNRTKNNKVSLICLSVLFLTFFTIILFKFSMIETQISDVIRFRGKSNFILLNVDKNTSKKLEKSKDIKNIFIYEDKTDKKDNKTKNLKMVYENTNGEIVLYAVSNSHSDKGKVEVNTKVTKSLDDAVKVWEFVKDSK